MTPWGRHSNLKKAYKYLENKYVQKIIIHDTFYDFKSGGYYFLAYPEDKNDILFRIVQTNKGMTSFIIPQSSERFDFKDNLFNVLWEREINDDISVLIEGVYPCKVSVQTRVHKNTVYNDYIENIGLDMIPSFFDVIDEVDWNYVVISFAIK